MEFDKKYIAKIIQNARKQKGLKQSELAEMIGISEKHLSKIETGNNYPALNNFLKMVQVLDLSLKDFGLNDNSRLSEQKTYIQKIINTSTEKQLNTYAEVINVLSKHI